MRKGGFSLVELLVAILFLSLVLLSLLSVVSSANQESMDAYYELVCFSLAKEPIEVFRAFGAAWLASYPAHPLDRFPADGAFSAIPPRTSRDQYPFDAESFERRIVLQPGLVENGVRAVKVAVTVRPVKATRAETWFSRDEVSLEALVVEGPGR